MPWVCGKASCPTHSSPEHACRGWRLAPIAASVGKGGSNSARDVKIIQGGLNRVVTPGRPSVRLKTDGNCTPDVIAAIQGFQRLAFGSERPDGRVDAGGRTYKALARQLQYKRIAVSLADQWLEAYEDGRTIYSFPCVTGAEDHPTDPGTFKIFQKYKDYRSRTYGVDMDYAMFFTRDGKAIHQYHGLAGLTAVRIMRKNVSDWFGSRGCVRMDEAHARALFNWTPIGTVVHVH